MRGFRRATRIRGNFVRWDCPRHYCLSISRTATCCFGVVTGRNNVAEMLRSFLIQPETFLSHSILHERSRGLSDCLTFHVRNVTIELVWFLFLISFVALRFRRGFSKNVSFIVSNFNLKDWMQCEIIVPLLQLHLQYPVYIQNAGIKLNPWRNIVSKVILLFRR